MREPTIRFGYPEEWERFRVRHPVFLERYGTLLSVIEAAFVRSWESREPVARVIYFLGRTCTEDFAEIVLLCGNGYGLAASKLVRGMFERALITRHLHDHPDEVDQFLDYYWVGQKKMLRATDAIFGADVLSGAQRARIDEEYERVKGQFTFPSCETCGTKRLHHSWTKLNVVAMAQPYDLYRNIVVEAYLAPTQHVHASVQSFLSRGRATSSGLEFDGEPQPVNADLALMSAHNILLDILQVQHDQFHLEAFEPMIERCRGDFIDAWNGHRKGSV